MTLSGTVAARNSPEHAIGTFGGPSQYPPYQWRDDTGQAHGFGVQLGRTALLTWSQDNLPRIQAPGRHDTIRDQRESRFQWPPFTWRTALRSSTWFALPVLLLLALVLGWNKALRKRVASKTTALEHELERRRAVEAKLQFASTHDHLTQLPTRAEFCRLVDAMRAGHPRRGQVTAIQVINLQQTIAAFGHEAGEELTNRYASHLRTLQWPAIASLSPGLFATYSWIDEKAYAIEPPPLDDAIIEPQIRAGAATAIDSGVTTTELLRRAETALWFSGQPHVTRYDSTLEPDPNDLILVRDFKRFGHAEIEAVFQPQYNLQTRRITALETLMRWTHPDIGLVDPEQLVPLLEQAGLTAMLTRKMLDAAIRMARDCRRAGVPMRISVNISATDLFEHNLPALVQERLRETGGDAEALMLEVTETSLIANPAQAQGVMAQIRNTGIRWSLDDFGTGYSSLTFLSDLPLDEIKIDQSFVTDMTADSRHHAIVHAIINLAHELGLRVVAEGAEAEHTLIALHAAGCNYAQGYTLSRPLAAAQVLALLSPNAA